jgi:hypothetical protein
MDPGEAKSDDHQPGTSPTIAQPDVVKGQPESKPSRAYILQMGSGENILVLKEAIVKLTL